MRLGWRTNTEAIPPTQSVPILTTPFAVSSKQDDPAVLMLQQRRSALLLREKIANELEDSVLNDAQSHFADANCFVPSGQVKLHRWQVDQSPTDLSEVSSDIIDIEAFYLQRLVVTNQQYQAFVDHGGYDQAALWHESVWPRVGEFLDQTGNAGPRYWSGGYHNESRSDHPVVGVSWFEADAYARWVGMRLPTDGEWVRAASAPIEANDKIIQRKYPWGDSFLPNYANLGENDCRSSCAANALPDGDSAFEVRQLIGNVWEWTASSVAFWTGDEVVDSDKPLRSLRGGAFDSYLGSQATCQCRSADSPMKRSHNIGFRCAVNASDLIRLDHMPGECDRSAVAMEGA